LFYHFLDLLLQVNSSKSQEQYHGQEQGLTPNVRMQGVTLYPPPDKVVISLQVLCVG